jgi:hypothetical protein
MLLRFSIASNTSMTSTLLKPILGPGIARRLDH